MTISEEQRQVLLDRLAKAREAKEAKKALNAPSDPTPPKPRKSRAKPKADPVPPSPPTIPPPTQSSPEIPVQPPADQNIILSTTEITASKSPENLTTTSSAPIPIPPSKSRKPKPVESEDDEDIGLSQKQKQQKKAYAKVVFYQQPSAKKMDKIMKQLHNETSDSESESEDEAPPQPQRDHQAIARHLPPQPVVHRRQPYQQPHQSQQRTDYLRQLALHFYS